MQLLDMRCPACGAVLANKGTGRIVTCEYCGSRFALDEEPNPFVEDSNSGTYEEEDEDYSSSSMADFAAEACEDFLANFGSGDRFESSRKILNGLDVGDEEVFLIHDDTLFKSGKNGFAITEDGIYCRDLWADPFFFDWATYANMEEPVVDGGSIECGEDVVCYFTNDDDLMPALLRLYQKLYKHAKQCA